MAEADFPLKEHPNTNSQSFPITARPTPPSPLMEDRVGKGSVG